MSDASTSTNTPADQKDDSSSPTYRRPIYQADTTGSLWGDLVGAVKRISLKDDSQNLGQMPCARKSLLSGIASGTGVGVLRAMNVGIMPACNWAVATFVLVSLGSWHICQNAINEERKKVQHVVEDMPRRMLKKPSGTEGSSGGSEGPKPS